MQSTAATTAFPETVSSTSQGARARARLCVALEASANGPAFFARLGEVDGQVAEIDRIEIGRGLGVTAQGVTAIARGERVATRTRLIRTDDAIGPVGVLGVAAGRERPSTRLLAQLTEAARALEALTPQAPAHMVLRDDQVVFACSSAAAWLRWAPWPSLVARLLETEGPGPVVFEGAIARSTAFVGGGRGARLVHLSAAGRALLDPLASLTAAQRRIVAFAAVGATLPEVARSMEVSVETVRSHLREAYRRLGIASRAELAAIVARSAD